MHEMDDTNDPHAVEPPKTDPAGPEPDGPAAA